jgi:hypothetical protein
MPFWQLQYNWQYKGINLEIEVLEEPVKGLFGVFGGKDAKIKASVIQSMGEKTRNFLKNCLKKWIWKPN